ncbi:RDD family protein [Phosphitispora fastidiosa]|uniref:RDD family protein n=1 Tax=Phosphitispora fastidiosa TaxID=2837202 RepID=UPI001E5459B5|nr:RDD family protein [Phosphitispora fastidiosa]MBU7006832.1 putative RDD family membrane protein YckC [Phosphitispora fastidiosa]
MQDLSLYSSEKIYYSYRLGGLGSRFIGLILDSLILGVAYLVLGGFTAAMVGVFGGALSEKLIIVVVAVVLILYFLLSFGYFIFFETIWNGQTPGKRAAGLRVVRRTGEAVTFGSVFVRNLMRIVDALPAGNAIGMIAIFFSENRQRVGDMVADTIVVREKNLSEPVILDSFSVSADTDMGEHLRAYIHLIDERDFNLIRDFFARVPKMKPEAVDAAAEKIARGLAGKLGLPKGETINPADFMKTIGSMYRER